MQTSIGTTNAPSGVFCDPSKFFHAATVHLDIRHPCFTRSSQLTVCNQFISLNCKYPIQLQCPYLTYRLHVNISCPQF
jgi:hypothetical protein